MTARPPDDATGPDSTEPQVELTDPRALRALAHPVRLALVDALSLHGPLTATQASEIVGESPSNCSFHLRQLGRYGVVEEVEGEDRRSRPWRMAPGGINVGAGDSSDGESLAAIRALDEAFAAQQHSVLVDWARRAAAEPAEWRTASFGSYGVVWLTTEELTQLNADLIELLRRFGDRREQPDTRPAGSRPVRILLNGIPASYVPAEPDLGEPDTD